MAISYLILTLALSNMQPDTVVEPAAFMNDRILLRDTGGLLRISGGNPWAAPDPDKGYPQSFRQVPAQQPPMPANRPHYITPEEFKSLERVPRPQQFYGQYRAPLERERLFENRAYVFPPYDDFGSYDQGRSPLGGLYDYPSFQGIDRLMNPYGVSPYEGSSPFTY